MLEYYSNPLVSDNYTSDGSGTGSFTSAMSALSPGTTYYLRAYATTHWEQATEPVSFITPKYPQTITFTELPLSTYGDGDKTLKPQLPQALM
jgi:hypothetical protein